MEAARTFIPSLRHKMRAGSAMDLEATVCLLQSPVHSSRAGISPSVEGQPHFPAVLSSTRPGR